jgi:hypothetical protein
VVRNGTSWVPTEWHEQQQNLVYGVVVLDIGVKLPALIPFTCLAPPSLCQAGRHLGVLRGSSGSRVHALRVVVVH